MRGIFGLDLQLPYYLIIFNDSRFQNFLSYFLIVFRQFPENSDLHASLGKLLLQTGRAQQAFEQLGAALTFQPTHCPALLAAGAMMQVCTTRSFTIYVNNVSYLNMGCTANCCI